MVEAVTAYLRGVLQSLEEERPFAAGFYLKELVSEGLIDALFEAALREAQHAEDLWWQVRALQELGWTTELVALLNEHSTEIEESGNPDLTVLLSRAQGDTRRAAQIRKETARQMRISVMGEDDDSGE